MLGGRKVNRIVEAGGGIDISHMRDRGGFRGGHAV